MALAKEFIETHFIPKPEKGIPYSVEKTDLFIEKLNELIMGDGLEIYSYLPVINYSPYTVHIIKS